jgi:hypothetical protein
MLDTEGRCGDEGIVAAGVGATRLLRRLMIVLIWNPKMLDLYCFCQQQKTLRGGSQRR